MPFDGFECSRCGDCCRRVGHSLVALTEDELRAFETSGRGRNFAAFRSDDRVFFFEPLKTYQVLGKQTAVEHCAFLTVDAENRPACGMELEYEFKPAVCRDFPRNPEHGVQFSNCPGCRSVLGDERSDEIRRDALGLAGLPEEEAAELWRRMHPAADTEREN